MCIITILFEVKFIYNEYTYCKCTTYRVLTNVYTYVTHPIQIWNITPHPQKVASYLFSLSPHTTILQS